MVKIMELNELSYGDYHNINLSIEEKSFYSIVGGNNSGKTTLFKLMTGLIMTDDHIFCDGIILNHDSIDIYIQSIGIVERVNNNSFIYQNVYNEMVYPLYNLNYSKKAINNRINKVLKYFEMQDIKDKRIIDLTKEEKQILLIMISLLHKPKVLLMDSVLNILSPGRSKKVISILKELIKKEKLTIINFTSNLNETLLSDKLILLKDFKIIGEYLPSKIYEDDKLFYQNNLEIPIICDLSIKLKMYNLINKDYYDMKEMVDDIWP